MLVTDEFFVVRGKDIHEWHVLIKQESDILHGNCFLLSNRVWNFAGDEAFVDTVAGEHLGSLVWDLVFYRL